MSGSVGALGWQRPRATRQRVAGYQPRTALERMRVARALATLPQLEAAFAGGRSYSAIRELTRVATPATEAEWLAKTAGKNTRELEEMVAGRKPGDRPGDRPEPGIARTAVDEAFAHVGEGAPLELLIREALRRCPKPRR